MSTGPSRGSESGEQTATHPADALLVIEGLVKQFGSLVAVDDVDLAIPDGETHSVIGPNGAGKTTLFNMIAGTLDPTEGQIYFDDVEITSMTEDERARRGISRAFQITQLFPDLPVRENLRLAAQSQQQDFNPLHRTDSTLVDRADTMLEQIGIDAQPTTPAKNLSHGDKKKLEIGMALITDPALLLLDEPTSGVAEGESRALMTFLEESTEGLTTLLIEHDIDIVLELSDRITVLDRGSQIARGTPGEITANEQVQEAYMGGY